MTIDTYDRVDLTGPWAGFGFQGHRFFTPENYDIEPCDMRFWALTCAIAREWSLMMSEERNARSSNPRKPTSTRSPGSFVVSAGSNVICLRDVIRRRREMRLSVVDGTGSADRARVVRHTRGPRAPRRG
ncbi:hypothetical protein [Xanthomonas arboricola]|uniref:Uncharacterized protein n=2 Tax=Xanthomonas arboricola pv. pruni TaxID=69929 RepID=A0AAP4KDW6_9XANT|nr:hypothetical protein [Xanthomonas arboricola]MDN0272749.1 hypothetical protein [Xanthomonas arboricola pv. pruni]MDN0289147.1 hypothetical protein [Xanthomonas arboricola pv. pruni]MDN0293299.1 hypothetical protein [Xanthomonas arboricola pv. pruni]MDN0297401.1 hypothetical protein [Xanthomonas arboricola pv. pruni]MDN0301503.1 hypothetical protein [Xanthomonas arboricola pv. pruni]